jgi:hypothetical protein
VETYLAIEAREFKIETASEGRNPNANLV